MDNKLIQWPRAKYWDRAWNPIIGCRPCSPACEHCYARAWAERFGQSFEPHGTRSILPPRSGVVFCGNMTDLFGGWIPDGLSYSFIDRCIHRNRATYLWLTKRIWSMQCILSERFRSKLRGHYFGFTAEDQDYYDYRVAALRVFPPWANPWLSAEPLLGPLAIGGHLNDLRWVVVGCESGPRRRPCKIEWVEDIVDQCRAAAVPVFVKQLDIDGRCVTDINKFPEHLRIRQVPWA